METRVTLDFECCHCGQPVTVTVHCSGDVNKIGKMRLVACVSVPCPDCQRVSQLYFDPVGRVHAVQPHAGPRSVPEPSLN